MLSLEPAFCRNWALSSWRNLLATLERHRHLSSQQECAGKRRGLGNVPVRMLLDWAIQYQSQKVRPVLQGLTSEH